MALHDSIIHQTPPGTRGTYDLSDASGEELSEEPFASAELPHDPRFREGADKINKTGLYGGAGGKLLVWSLAIALSISVLFGLARLIEFIF